jgi:hypothetical protein
MKFVFQINDFYEYVWQYESLFQRLPTSIVLSWQWLPNGLDCYFMVMFIVYHQI